MEVLQDKENQLFGRRELVVKMAVPNETPSRKHVMEEVQKQFAAAADTIVIDKIEHPFGTKYTKIFVKIYEKAEGARKEPAYKKARGTKKEKASEEKK